MELIFLCTGIWLECGASCFSSQRKRRKSVHYTDKYQVIQQIGEGKTGKVYRAAVINQEQKCVAIKRITYDYLNTPERNDAVQEELDILASIKHPHVLSLINIYEDDVGIAIVMEEATGGPLIQTLCRSVPNAPRLFEKDIQNIMRQLLEVLAYLHSRGITHRDIKLDNILCRAKGINDIVLIDFGLAHKSKPGIPDMTGLNGTCHYMAPEMFNRSSTYGCEIDIWAVGVVLYILLFGCYPFDAKFMSQVEDKIVAGDYIIPSDQAMEAPGAVKFLQYLLIVNPLERPPARMALQHPWLYGETSTRPLGTEHLNRLRRFSDVNFGKSRPKRSTRALTESSNATSEAYEQEM